MSLIKPLSIFLLLSILWLSDARADKPLVRIGYFPNLTHAQALIGFARGDFHAALQADAEVRGTVFNAGPALIEALFAGEVDLAYVGPNPAISGFVRSGGQALRVIAGAADGGSALIVRADSGIHSPKDLSGHRLSSPQLGNSQDIALRYFLNTQSLETTQKGGTVEVMPMAAAQIYNLFRRKQIDGAWVPEPWASSLVLEAEGQVLIDERSVWPSGQFATALVIARSEFLGQHMTLVSKFLAAHVEITQWANDQPQQARELVKQEIRRITRKQLPEPVLNRALEQIRFTWDPLQTSVEQSARAALAVGFYRHAPNLRGMFQLGLLNRVLKTKGLTPIESRP